MKVVIDTLKEKGIRDDYIVMVGGAPLNEEFGAVRRGRRVLPRRRGGGRDGARARREASRRRLGRLMRRSPGHRLRRAGARDSSRSPVSCRTSRSHACRQSCTTVRAASRARSAAASPTPEPTASTTSSWPMPTAAPAASWTASSPREGWTGCPARTATSSTRVPLRSRALAEEEVGTFYLTDFLARNFDRLVWRGLGLDRHPELLADYFGNYRRLVYLAQTDDPALARCGRGGCRPAGPRPSSSEYRPRRPRRVGARVRWGCLTCRAC